MMVVVGVLMMLIVMVMKIDLGRGSLDVLLLSLHGSSFLTLAMVTSGDDLQCDYDDGVMVLVEW